jgi:AhpD family alkylhydroperoxidase
VTDVTFVGCYVVPGHLVIEVDLPTTGEQRSSTVEARLKIFENPVSNKFLKYINAASRVISESPLPAVTKELASLRVSQINGCAFCVDMHAKELAHAGESAERINLVAAWREANCYTEAERAVFEFAEQGTRIADGHGGVTDEAWANAAKHFDEDQMAALSALIAFMGTVNRMNVITQQPGGDYKIGQFAGQFG